MIRAAHAAATALIALGAACSAPEDTAAPRVTPDEQRALAEARAMIPSGEAAPEPPPTENPTP